MRFHEYGFSGSLYWYPWISEIIYSNLGEMKFCSEGGAEGGGAEGGCERLGAGGKRS
jgi:hypothetical protein